MLFIGLVEVHKLIKGFPLMLKGPDGLNYTSLRLNVTELRINPSYSIYVNWSQTLVLGLIPAILLIYFNTKIYLDVRSVIFALMPNPGVNPLSPTNFK